MRSLQEQSGLTCIDTYELDETWTGMNPIRKMRINDAVSPVREVVEGMGMTLPHFLTTGFQNRVFHAISDIESNIGNDGWKMRKLLQTADGDTITEKWSILHDVPGWMFVGVIIELKFSKRRMTENTIQKPSDDEVIAAARQHCRGQ